MTEKEIFEPYAVVALAALKELEKIEGKLIRKINPKIKYYPVKQQE